MFRSYLRLEIRTTFIIIWTCLFFNPLFAQQTEEETSEPQLNRDPHLLTKDSLEVIITDRFDFIFNRGFLFISGMPDSVPINPATSGTTFIGLSFNLLFNKKFAIHFQPGLSFFKINYLQKSGKTFPSIGDSLYEYERQRMYYVEVPIGFRWNFLRDSIKGRIQTFVEVGASLGYLLGSSYKLKLNYQGKATIMKIPDIPNVNIIRAGLYAKLNYRFFGFWVFYRLTELFRYSATYRTANGGEGNYPKIAPLELGVAVVF
ncbi:MAG: PorT family protein [Bacteroidia bacterium]|nr:PorT family protein [Bacteroidia bacterium]